MAEQNSEDRILNNALSPKRASGDTGSVEQHSIPDQIAADKYATSKANARRRGFPIKFVKIIPPGAAD